MIKRNIIETIYEYDKEGKLLKKTVIETHEEEDNTTTTYPSWTYLNGVQSCSATKVNLTYSDDECVIGIG